MFDEQQKQEIRRMIEEALERRSTAGQFGIPAIPYHIHNEADAPRVNITNLSTTNIPTDSDDLTAANIRSNGGILTLGVLSLPTSPSGLSTGDIWNDSGVLTVV